MLELRDKTRARANRVVTHHQHNRHVILTNTFIRRHTGARSPLQLLDYSRLPSSPQTQGSTCSRAGLGQVNRGGEEEGDDRGEVSSTVGLQVSEGRVLTPALSLHIQTPAHLSGVGLSADPLH